MQTQNLQPAQEKKFKFLSSSNFWTAVVLAVGGFFVGFPESEARNVVALFFAIVSGGKLLHEYFKSRPETDVEATVNNSNWWNYIATIVVSIVPTLPVDLIDQLETIARNIVGGNWQGVLVGLFSVATIVYNLWQDRKKKEQEQAKVSLN